MSQPRRPVGASRAAAATLADTIAWKIEAAYREGLSRAATVAAEVADGTLGQAHDAQMIVVEAIQHERKLMEVGA